MRAKARWKSGGRSARRIPVVVMLICLVSTTASPALAGRTFHDSVASAGELDPNFGVAGVVTTDVGPEGDSADAVAIQPDGKIVVAGEAGYGSEFALARYQPNGTLDAGFGEDGIVTTHIGGSGGAYAMALQPDGRILVAGGGARFALARYTPDGDLDPSFGGDGIVKTNFHRNYDVAYALAIQPDGRIVAAGVSSIKARELALDDTKVAVARYNQDGSLDTSFGGDGRVATYFAGTYNAARAVVIQADGRIVIAGTASGYRTFALVRYNPDGTRDTGFGEGGRVVTNFDQGSIEIVNGVALQADGKIVAVGGEPSGLGFALARYEPDGALDQAFGVEGKVRTDFQTHPELGHVSGDARGVAIQVDGRIVVAGGAPAQFGGDTQFALARYLTDGSLDPTFGQDGKVSTELSEDGNDSAFGIAIQADGKVVIVGTTNHFGPDATFVVARYALT